MVYLLVLKSTLFTDQTPETVTNTKATSATSVSTRNSTMIEFMNMITSDTSLAIGTKSSHDTTWALSSTTSQNANNDISPVMTETSTQETTGIAHVDKKPPLCHGLYM